jgi:hypothetical protein
MRTEVNGKEKDVSTDWSAGGIEGCEEALRE